MKTTARNMIFIVIMIICFFCVYAQENDHVKPAKEETGIVYNNDDCKISFPVPPQLELYTPEKPGPLAPLFTTGQIVYLVNPYFPDENVGVMCSENITRADMIVYFNQLASTYPPQMTVLPGYKKIFARLIKIGKKSDKEAVEHVFNMKGNVAGTIRQVVFIHNGKGFTFTCGTSEERYNETNKKIFDIIFSEMQFH